MKWLGWGRSKRPQICLREIPHGVVHPHWLKQLRLGLRVVHGRKCRRPQPHQHIRQLNVYILGSLREADSIHAQRITISSSASMSCAAPAASSSDCPSSCQKVFNWVLIRVKTSSELNRLTFAKASCYNYIEAAFPTRNRPVTRCPQSPPAPRTLTNLWQGLIQ